MTKVYLRYFLSVFIFIINHALYGQFTISGTVMDEKEQPIPYANILAQTKDTIPSVLSYTYGNEKGFYTLKVNDISSFSLVVSALGYAKKIVDVNITNQNTLLNMPLVLEEEELLLEEVIVQDVLPLKIEKDTITFNAEYYTRGNEVVIEDLLKNLPGVNVDANGKISVGNQEIEKLMVDGDDLFEKGYKILSKSLPVYPVETIEVLKRFSNNPLLKGIEASDKVAINLNLKEDSKNIWFGDITLGYDISLKEQYSAKGNLANFGKKNKYYFLSSLNNTGDDVTGDVKQLIKPYRSNDPGSLGDEQQIKSLQNFSTFVPGFKQSRTNFNNVELASLNAIFNPTEKFKIKTLGFFNSDENDFTSNSVSIFNANETDFTNVENFDLRKKKITGFGKLDVEYKIATNQSLTTTTKYNNSGFNDRSNLDFNAVATLQSLDARNVFFDQKINYTHKFEKTKVFLLTARYINEKLPQSYEINQFFYQDLFLETTEANTVFQDTKNEYKFLGFEAHLLDRKKNGNLLELKMGNALRKDDFYSTLALRNDETVLDQPVGFQNNVRYAINDLYFKTKYLIKLKTLSLTGALDAHQLFVNLNQTNSVNNKAPFIINPELSFEWELNKTNILSGSFGYKTTNATVLQTTDNFALTSFRNFSKGTGEFNQLSSSDYRVNYQVSDYGGKFFANAALSYSKDFDFFTNNTRIDQNFSLSENILIKDRDFIAAATSVNYYFKFMKSNLNLDLSYLDSNYQNIVNDSELRTVNSLAYNYGLRLRSGFSGIFNYHAGAQWMLKALEVETLKTSFTDMTSFLDLSFIFNDNFNIELQSEQYFFGNLEGDNTYYFLDFSAKYVLKKDKLTLFFDGRNLFNNDSFRTYYINDVGNTTTQYRLLPRILLLKLAYRF